MMQNLVQVGLSSPLNRDFWLLSSEFGKPVEYTYVGAAFEMELIYNENRFHNRARGFSANYGHQDVLKTVYINNLIDVVYNQIKGLSRLETIDDDEAASDFCWLKITDQDKQNFISTSYPNQPSGCFEGGFCSQETTNCYTVWCQVWLCS
jgi:hypothetical protein